MSVMCTHGPIAPQGTSRVAVSGVWKDVVIHLIVPRFDKLENRPVADHNRDRDYTDDTTPK